MGMLLPGWMPSRPWLGHVEGACSGRRQAGQRGGRWAPSRRRLLSILEATHQQCLYHTLGVPRTATKAEVKAAYRRLARIYHPDVNPVSLGPEHFQAISEAYEVLSDDARREAYDQYGPAGLGGQSSQARAWRHAGDKGAPEVGGNVQAVLAISLHEAALGGERELQVSVLGGCAECAGSGTAAGTQAQGCKVCLGTGEILKSQKVNAYGMRLQTPSPCPACGGRGTRDVKACPGCAGHGLRRQLRSLRVRIPPGVDEGSVLRLKGCGDQGRGGGPAGDVHVRFLVKQQEGVRREGADLHSHLPLPLWNAILGGPATVETLRGSTTIHIPPGTQHGTTLSLPRQGLPRLGGPASATGAHHFKVSIVLPRTEALDGAELALLSQLSRLQGGQRAQQAAGTEQGPGRAAHGGRSGAAAAGGGAASRGQWDGGELPRQGRRQQQWPGRAQDEVAVPHSWAAHELPRQQAGLGAAAGGAPASSPQQPQGQGEDPQQRQRLRRMQRASAEQAREQPSQQGWGTASEAAQAGRRGRRSAAGRLGAGPSYQDAVVSVESGQEVEDLDWLVNTVMELQAELGDFDGRGE